MISEFKHTHTDDKIHEENTKNPSENNSQMDLDDLIFSDEYIKLHSER